MKLKSRGCTVFELEFVIMLLAVSMLSMKQSQEGVQFLSWNFVIKFKRHETKVRIEYSF